MACTPLLYQYSLFTKARNLGIRFSPSDLSLEMINNLSTIKNEIDKSQDRKRKKEGAGHGSRQVRVPHRPRKPKR